MTSSQDGFRRRVAGVFATRVAQFVIGFANSFLLARLLGPAGRGAFYLVTLTPTVLASVGQFGLPSALSFFSGRGRSAAALLRTALLVGIGLAAALAAGTLLVLPWLEATVLRAAPADLLRLALISLPFQFVAGFIGSVLIGRQVMRNYNLILIGQTVIALLLTIVLVAWLGLGVFGAVLANILVAASGAAAVAIEGRRLLRTEGGRGPGIRGGELLGYGMRLYPASVTSFLSYRLDVYLLGWLLGDAVQIGLYSMAVSLAELTFFVPDSVATVFFPRVAGADRLNADEMTPMVCRFTVLVTLLVSLALIPAAFVAVNVILPAFVACMPAFLVILPGVVALSVSKILSSYVSGLGLPAPVALASSVALVINVVANILLIPTAGIVGSAAASLISYTVHAVMLVTISSGLAGKPASAFVIPGGAEWTRLVTGLRQIAALLRRAPAGEAS
ncbi:MAG: oligosaccharide flippase family protein [Chloroflexota bacterium]|nr:oligosaccharide flippase family protein [Chloroflexota bacterium]